MLSHVFTDLTHYAAANEAQLRNKRRRQSSGGGDRAGQTAVATAATGTASL